MGLPSLETVTFIIATIGCYYGLSAKGGTQGVGRATTQAVVAASVLILVSAVLAFPAPWKHKAIGIGLGFVAIQALNLVRIISLYYLQRWNSVWFEWFHLYLWQALIILDALVFWLIWLRWLPRGSELGDPPATTPA